MSEGTPPFNPRRANRFGPALPPRTFAGFAAALPGELRHFSRPSIDVLFDSAADIYGERLLGIILTGASQDGA
jgi:hypothetical protein